MKCPAEFRSGAASRLARAITGLVLAIAALASTGAAHAQAITRLVVAFPPGGPSDLLARVIAERLGNALGQSIVVENRPGANGAIAALFVTHEPADGKTMWLTTAGAIVINPHLYPKLTYSLDDLAAVSLIVNTPEMLVVNPKNPATDAKTFIANAAKATQTNFASTGIGSMPHMGIALLSKATGVKFIHIPEKGAAPAINDLLGGHVDAFIGDVPGLVGHVQSGHLKALAIAAPKRSEIFPEVRTFAEQGIAGTEMNNWSAMYVFAKTPAPLIEKINKAVRDTLAEPAVHKRLVDLGVDPQSTSPAEMTALAERDGAKWKQVIRENDIKAE
ncbi:MAG TPA: tripartite tricarboxylate transporter substrate binding protein [Burkholderiales bacterium]|nr:tripartite tricarboxylate transporter substrate binding protein [Burkholderiales bacterium]